MNLFPALFHVWIIHRLYGDSLLQKELSNKIASRLKYVRQNIRYSTLQTIHYYRDKCYDLLSGSCFDTLVSLAIKGGNFLIHVGVL